ncbi:MAG TPA: DUF2330 domain-containing protein [Minicystis sp.]|nr:DUF2330 domain-containing protein [Minicystis sp.]
MSSRAPAALAVAIAVAVGLAPAAAEACAPAPPRGGFVDVAGEDAIIAYDPLHGREDFVRRASFRTTVKDFGFLVPTPTKPELAAAPDAIFDRLAEVIAPPVRRVTRFDDGLTLTSLSVALRPGAKSAAPAVAAAVEVLEQKRVAGLDAAVLAADDASALAAWLAEHGYDARPALAKWLEPYVAKRWIVTAFKVAKAASDEDRGVSTEALRMTFTTDKPFFPYREPEDQRENLPAAAKAETRTLRAYVLSPDRAVGALGNGAAWPGKVLYSEPARADVMGGLPFPLPPNAWLTAFEDTSSPRPGVDDLFFTASADKSPVVPAPIEDVEHLPIPIPIELAAAVGLVAGYAALRRRRRRAAR